MTGYSSTNLAVTANPRPDAVTGLRPGPGHGGFSVPDDRQDIELARQREDDLISGRRRSR